MEDYLKQAFYFSILFVAFDLFAKIMLRMFWPEWRGTDLIVTLLLGVWLGILYFVSCLFWKGKYRQGLLPAIRVVFWGVVVLVGILNGNRMATEDLLYANNELFNVWLLFGRVVDLRNTSESVELIFQDILLLGFFEWILIFLANLIVAKRYRLISRI
jgi:hypothetical protein